MEHLSPTQVKIILKVRDYGIGINAEDLQNLFQPYFKTTDNKSKSLNSKSHGLGLSICKRIVETMSGQILVDSRMGEGTEFIIQFVADVFVEEKNKTSNETNSISINKVSLFFYSTLNSE